VASCGSRPQAFRAMASYMALASLPWASRGRCHVLALASPAKASCSMFDQEPTDAIESSVDWVSARTIATHTPRLIPSGSPSCAISCLNEGPGVEIAEKAKEIGEVCDLGPWSVIGLMFDFHSRSVPASRYPKCLPSPGPLRPCTEDRGLWSPFADQMCCPVI
jgi:hypothetical protein